MDTNYNPFSLQGKTILVTGASSGIGKATAIACSKMGADIIAVGRNEERLEATMSELEGVNNLKCLVDLAEQDEVEKFVDTMPCINGCVLCAGIGMTKPFQFSTREDYDKVFNVNYYATIELLRLLVKRKKMLKGGSVVMVSSIGGVRSFNPGNGIYGASKAALNSTMKFCAIELAPKKIRVNSVNPGMVHTKLINPNTISEDQLKQDMEKYPLKRYGEPSDIANGIIYLLSEASSWVTGHSLVIDGGYTI
jgi:NAD(P)-dependent dehydrogenase (short-subunit alcohol dehydrogenase family)